MMELLEYLDTLHGLESIVLLEHLDSLHENLWKNYSSSVSLIGSN